MNGDAVSSRANETAWTFLRRIVWGLLWLYGVFGVAPTVGYFLGLYWWPALVAFVPAAGTLGWAAYLAGKSMES